MSTEAPQTELGAVELEDWFTEMKYENSSTVSEALSSCYGALEHTWESKSGDYRLVRESKLRTTIASCKGFISLALGRQLSTCRDEGEYWYRINLASGVTSTVLFIFLTILLARLRRSNRIRHKLKSCKPTIIDKGKKSLFSFMKKSPSTSKTDTAMTPAYQPLIKQTLSTPAFSTSTLQETDYNYIIDSPYSVGTMAMGTAQLNHVFIPRSQIGSLSSSESPRRLNNTTSGPPAAVLGLPPSPYPTPTPRGTGTGSTTVTPVTISTPAVRENAGIVQAEIIEGGQHAQLLQGSERDRNLYFVIDTTQSTE